MKKLILILTILIGLNSCTYEIPISNIVVTDILTFKDKYCKYIGEDNGTHYNILNHTVPCIIDTCGKHNIGDTIVFVKK